MKFLDRARALLEGKEVGPLKEKKEQDLETREIISFVDSKLSEIQTYGQRQQLENQWLTNSAYAIGYDNLMFDNTASSFRLAFRTAAPMKKNSMRVNKILPALQRRTARLCKNKPRFEVYPDNSSDESKDVARKEREILGFYWEKERIQEKRIQATMLLQTHGLVFFKVCWDDMRGEIIEDPTTGEKIYEGDVRVDVVSTFEVYPDYQAKSLDDCRYLIHAKIRPLSYFRDSYELGYLVEAESTSALTSMQYEQRINTMHGANSSAGGSSEVKDAAIEKIYYEAPSRMRPNGRMVITANGVLLEDKDLPVGEIPFVKFDDVVVGGRFYPEATVTHARPIQDQFNKLISRRADWCNKLVAGKFIAPRGCNLSEDSLTDRSGEVLYYDPVPNAAPPSAMNIPMMPQYVYQEEEALDRWLYDIFGESDISRGDLPSASMPALGMQILLEVDASRMGIETEQHEHAFARLGRLMLKYLEKYAQNERLMKMGSGTEYNIQKFSGSDIKSKHEVCVIRGSLAPQSQAQRRNDIMSLYSSGLLGNPQDPIVTQQVFAALEFGDLDEFWKTRSLRVAQVKKTIAEIEQGGLPVVHELDDHTLHIQIKNDYRLSDKFDSLGAQRQAVLLQDIEQHIQAQMRLTAPQFGMAVDRNDDIGNMDEMQINQSMIESEGMQGEAQAIDQTLAGGMNNE